MTKEEIRKQEEEVLNHFKSLSRSLNASFDLHSQRLQALEFLGRRLAKLREFEDAEDQKVETSK
jgi:hypothetical protein